MYQIIDNVSIHYEIKGTGEPIVFFHGLCLDLNFMKINYDSNFKYDKYQRIYIDIPDMGESQSFFEPQPSSDFLMKLLLRLLDTLEIDTFYLCGHSYGGYLSLGIAHLCPDRIKGLFLTCPVITANSNNRIVEQHLNILKDNFKLPQTKEAADFSKMNVIISEKAWQKYLTEILIGIKKCNFSFIKKLQCSNYKYYQFQEETGLKNWQSEIPLFLLLSRHDHIVGYKEQVKMARNFKKCNLLILENAGHNLPLDQPEMFSSCVKYFFNNKSN